MTEKEQLVGVSWWKFNSYEIGNGYIRPAEGAKLEEYDPWVDFEESKSTTAVKAPYLRLLELGCELPLDDFPLRLGSAVFTLSPGDRRNDVELSNQQKRHVLDWCSKYGLLGIAPHQFHSITVAPRWGTTGYGVSVLTRTFDRIGGSWRLSEERRAPDKPALSHWVDELVHESRLPQGCLKPGTTSLKLDRFAGREGFATEGFRTWARFFPSVPPREWETYSYPLPLSEEFWGAYCEPLDTFMESLSLFEFATQNRRNQSDDGQQHSRDLCLNWLVAPITRTTGRDQNHRIKGRWLCPSLLSALAEMAVEDAAEGKYRFACATCGGPVVSSGYQARYCSGPCRWRKNKRDARNRRQSAQSRETAPPK